MKSFTDYLNESCDCWKGYKRKPGTAPCSPGSCMKEETVTEGERGLWDNIHAKQKRIKAGSGERMRKPGSKGAPTAAALKASQNEELSADEQFDVIEEMVMAMAEEYSMDPELVWEKFEAVDDDTLYEAAVDAKGHKSSTGGLTQKGRDAYNAKGANLKAPVTTPPSKLKKGSKAANRRKSFCARMGGMEGAMKKPNGEPTRKALALRKWNC
jgi:hypothetical protein